MAEQISILDASGTHYTSISAWVAAVQQTDWSTSPDNPVLEIYKGDYTSLGGGVDILPSEADIVFGGFTGLSNAKRALIRVPVSERHNGWFGSGVRVEDATWGKVYIACGDYCDVEGMSVKLTNAQTYAFRSNGINEIRGCLGQAHQASFELNRYYTYGGFPTAINCVAHNSSVGFGSPSNWLKMKIKNCNAVNCPTGFSLSYGGDADLQNCLAISCTTAFNLKTNGAETRLISNNASTDTSTAGTSPVTNVSLVDGVDFVAPSTNDYNITATSKLLNAGIDLSTEFTTDITGAIRG